ncbi:MAG: sigma-70 family RNA polymerase sigma factor [Anaerolineae bacterium]|nr:sigma-70 family RNA polymerase sigma factor [Anaerolineae bacterium]
MKDRDDDTMAQQDLSTLTDASADSDRAQWTDSALIQACLEGCEEAWETLIERYSRLIYTIPLRFGMAKATADEIFQETCLILLEKLGTLKDQQRLSAWLVTVARRACIQRWRTRPNVQFVELNEQAAAKESSLEESLVHIEEQYQVHQALQQIDSRCQKLLHILFFEKSSPSYEEIAVALDMQVGSIGPTRIRCLDKLRRRMEELEGA